MSGRKIEPAVLWAWTWAAVSAPAAQFLGSAVWYVTLGCGIGTGALWAAAACRGISETPGIVRWLRMAVLTGALAVAARYCAACWHSAGYGTAIPLVLLVLSAGAAARGSWVCARCGAVLFFILAGLYGLLFLCALPDFHLEYAFPPWRPDGGRSAAVLLLPAAALCLPRRIADRPPLGWTAAIVLMGTAVSVLTAGALSPAVAANTPGAFFEMVREMRVLGTAERFEAVVAAAMTLGWFSLMCLLLSGTAEQAEGLRPGMGPAAGWISAGLAAGGMYVVQVIPAWALVVALTAAILLPLLLPFGTEGRKKKKKSEKGG